jgi:F-type H+-transporting ATPase subunit c
MDASRDLAAGLTIAIGGLGPAIGIGILAAAALQALGRNPDAERVITTNFIIALSFTEAIAIYSLVMALAIKFVG